MKTMSDGGILPTMCLEIIVTLVPGAMRMIQGVATGLEEPIIIIIIQTLRHRHHYRHHSLHHHENDRMILSLRIAREL